MTLPSFSQSGKVALVTGSRRGLGRAMALAFAEAGADLVISDMVVDDGLLEETANDIREFGSRVLVSPADVTDQAQVEQMVKSTIDEFGRIDILVNNAGISDRQVGSSGSGVNAFGESGNFYKVYDVTVKGTSLCTAAAAPTMVAQKSGCIINLSSMGAFLKRGWGAYTLAKSAIIDVTKGMATEYGPHNVRVNAIAPGVIRTDMTAGQLQFPEIVEFYEEMTPLGRLGEPEDIANAALLLASDAAWFITGQTILVDGGICPVDMRNLPIPGGFQGLRDLIASREASREE
jgi:3-oxoacyl-[acyl-carrier protein] reductase